MNLKDLAKKALEKAQKLEAERGPNFQRRFPPKPSAKFSDDQIVLEKNSDDALDHRGFKKGGFSKAEKRAYAQQKHMEDLVQPPKNPPPAWLNDPSLLPKKPPPKTDT